MRIQFARTGEGRPRNEMSPITRDSRGDCRIRRQTTIVRNIRVLSAVIQRANFAPSRESRDVAEGPGRDLYRRGR